MIQIMIFSKNKKLKKHFEYKETARYDKGGQLRKLKIR